MLIIFSGLPGVGKTTLAKELSHRINAVYLRVDTIEQAMANSTLKIRPAEDAGYEVAYAVATDNLNIGRTIVADSVNPIELTREAWINVATKSGSKWVEVEVVCSDVVEHQSRVEARKSDISGLEPPSWQSVLEREYHEWTRERIVLDTANKSVHASINELTCQLII